MTPYITTRDAGAGITRATLHDGSGQPTGSLDLSPCDVELLIAARSTMSAVEAFQMLKSEPRESAA